MEAVCHYLRTRGTNHGPFFVGRDRQVVTKVWFVQQVRDVLKRLGFPAHQYAGHSSRIGAATSAALAGMED